MAALLLAMPFFEPAFAQPVLSVTPTTLDFGIQQVGSTSAPQIVTVRNTGSETLTIQNVSLGGTNPGDFAQSTGCTGATLSSSQFCQVLVTFTPTATGSRSATLQFTTTAGTADVTLLGNGSTGDGPPSGGADTDPAVSVSPGGISFEDQPVGITSFPSTVIITNTGSAELHIRNTSIGGSDRDDFSKSVDTCTDAELQPGDSCTVGVTFKPSSVGSKSAHLTIESNADSSPDRVKITGRGVAPVVAFVPAGVSFGVQAVGITSEPVGVVVTNTGTGLLRIGHATIGGRDAGDFDKSADTCSGATLSEDDSCIVGVTFTPTTNGPRRATLDIGQNASGDIDSIDVTGIGSGPALTFNPPGLTFGDQAIDQTSAPQAVTLSNSGNAVLTISTVTIAGPNASEFGKSADLCSGATLNPGASCTVGINFTPHAAGTRTATLTVTDNSPGSPHTMQLFGGLGPMTREPIVGISATPSGRGYWVVARDGGVFAFGDARFFGSLGGMRLAEPVVGMAATPSGLGYWLVAADGGIFSFGDAQFRGSTGAIVLNAPIVGMAATPTGAGYWLVASDGGIFAFGDAGFFGSTGGLALSKPIVGMAASPSGAGYWLVASDGGVFAFGDATFLGSTGNLRLVQPIAGIAATRSGLGYWLVAADGGIFTFGDAGFVGSMGGSILKRPVVGMAPTPTGNGYWMVASDGGVFTFGDAPFVGSAAR